MLQNSFQNDGPLSNVCTTRSGVKRNLRPGLYVSVLIYYFLHTGLCAATSSRRPTDIVESNTTTSNTFTLASGSAAVYAYTIGQSTNVPPDEKTCLFFNATSGAPQIPSMGGENNSGKSGKLSCDIHELRRNPNCWLQCDDLSSISVYHEGWNGTCRKAVLISPRHVVMAAHFIPDQGGPGGPFSKPIQYIQDITNSPAIFWISPDNKVVRAELSAIIRNPHRADINSAGASDESLALWQNPGHIADLAIGILNKDLDTNLISVVKWLPEKKLPAVETFHGVATSRYLKVFPEECWNLHSSRFFSTGVQSPIDPATLNWSRYSGPYSQDGDSSSPNLLYDGKNLFLIGLNTSGGRNKVGGYNVMRPEEQQIIKNAMDVLDTHKNRLPHYELTIVGED